MDWIKTILKGMLKTLLIIIFKDKWRKFGDLLRDAVNAAGKKDELTGEDKMNQVYRQARTFLKEIGVELSSSFLRTLIEMSYQIEK